MCGMVGCVVQVVVGGEVVFQVVIDGIGFECGGYGGGNVCGCFVVVVFQVDGYWLVDCVDDVVQVVQCEGEWYLFVVCKIVGCGY